MPVWVELATVLPPKPLADRGEIPLRVRACGIDNAQVIEGELIAWYRVMTGAWWAQVRMQLSNRSGTASLPVTQLVPADAVRQRDDE